MPAKVSLLSTTNPYSSPSQKRSNPLLLQLQRFSHLLPTTYYLLPLSTFLFGLAYTISIYYIFRANQTSDVQRTTYNLQQAVAWFPFEEKYWEKWMQSLTHKEINTLFNSSTQLLKKLHIENAHLSQALGKSYKPNSSTSARYLMQAIGLNALEAENYFLLLKVYKQQSNTRAYMIILEAITDYYLNRYTYPFYPDIFDDSQQLSTRLDVNIKLYTKYQQLIQPFSFSARKESALSLAKLYYLFALNTNAHQEHLIPIYLETASRLAPELSHYQLEQANWHQLSGDVSKAQQIIDRCYTLSKLFPPPKDHCKWYEETYLEHSLSEQFGFLQADIMQL